VVSQVDGIYGFYDLPSGPYVAIITDSEEAMSIPFGGESSQQGRGSCTVDSAGSGSPTGSSATSSSATTSRDGLQLPPLVLRRITRLALLPLGGEATAAARRLGVDRGGLKLLRSALGAHTWLVCKLAVTCACALQ